MSPAFANRSSDGTLPRSSSSARGTSTVTGPTAASARPASAIVSPSSHSTADAAAIAQSPARRSTFSCALPPPGRKGSRTSVSSSPSPTAVVNGPTWKSLIGTTRSPSGPRITTVAFPAEHTALRSSAASAWQSEPPIVPRLRTTGSAMTFSASRKTGKCSASSSDSSSSTWRVSAPMAISSPSSRMYCRSVRSLMSISRAGFASRSFIIGSRLCPPAMTRASSCCLSAAIAPARLVARSYSNGAGVCISVLTADDRGAAGAVAGIEQAGVEAAVLDVAQDRAAGGAGGGDRRLAAEPRERERAARVDLGDARGLDGLRTREVAQPLGLRAGIQPLDQPHRVGQAGLLDQQALQRVDRGVEVGVDVGDDRVDRVGLGDDLADRGDRGVQPGDDLAQREDHRDEEVDEREHDQHDRDQQQDSGGGHQASSRITSSEPP